MKLIHEGSITTLTNGSAIHNELPKMVYDVQWSGNSGQFELHHRPPFVMPPKIYGGHDEFAKRCIKTFRSLNKGMGVLLSGNKGCGKTLTAKRIALDSGMPVICVTAPFAGPSFVEFLTELPNAAVIFIDEFEKTYARQEHRNEFLALLDGASDNKHLFVLTSNSNQIGEFFTNRPGRIRYHKQYNELPERVLLEMTEDLTEPGPIRDAICAFIKDRGEINPDILVSLVQECLIHNETPDKFIEFFNIKTELSLPF